MAISPGIPTSFVPKQPVQPTNARSSRSGSNIFFIIAFAIAGIVVALAAATFAYGKYLDHTLASKEAALATAQQQINEDSIEEFVRLRDRLATGRELMDNHIELSQFLDTLERLTLQNVRFNTLKLVVAGDQTAKIEIEGTARNFNALAAQSGALAGEKRIKRAIFSGISLSQENLVDFRLTADLDPRLVIAGDTQEAGVQQTPPAPAAQQPAAATTTGALRATTPVAPRATTTVPVASTSQTSPVAPRP